MRRFGRGGQKLVLLLEDLSSTTTRCEVSDALGGDFCC